MQERIEQTKEQCRAKLIPLRDAFESAKRKFQQVCSSRQQPAKSSAVGGHRAQAAAHVKWDGVYDQGTS